MEIGTKTIEAPPARIARASRGLFTHRIGGYFATVTILLCVGFIAGIAVGSSPVPAAIVARVLASHSLPHGWIDVSDVAGSVANPRALQKQPPDVTPEMTERLTREVHRPESLEGILSDWALPGDHTPAAAYDLARSVCRRAERCVVRLRETGEEVSDEVIRYLNRFSDLLWLFGRTLELRAGVDSRLRDEGRGGNPFSRAW